MTSLELKIPPPLVALLTGLLMWSATRLVPPLALPGVARVAVAAVLVGVGVGLAISGVLTFKRAKTTVNPTTPAAASALVRTGVFRFTRNPMYLGLLLCLVAWAVYLSNALALLIVPLFVLYMNRFQIAPEERALATLFGDAYAAYKREVRRW
ncbi:MAG TPA: isoprenylcysteine carboxylmethyltransferase family protein [Steroidobacteraceae bacterium]|nr:isoprenylcysteine carboxylmethyltransferase family protein [Steroidobacteraceae bacterium]HQW07963.1 isoprenylcysteine carboxylmethyltransferase family protein [Steroidobacteraceae bacterium]HQX46401.1 isoprenylcysteine carboxylmethyltransferase family protein [Steroidobacteraceae bacterium]HQX77202.1 isoprenylcysteine carboxylmethyltransferase family protein [Steroidobacteraceae bacterium]HQZ80651.1 isoprenylcysteine carboxylmethyltransferase family protein [Steroidobacteraceae bacterium]